MIRKAIVPLVAAVVMAGCAVSDTQNVSPSFNFNKDVRVGLEAESIGNWSLARSFLEHALKKDDDYRDSATFEDQRVLTDENREQALRALSRIYYTTGDLGALYAHLHQYWQVSDLQSVPWISSEQEKERYEYHLSWYCRLLDDQERFSEAQACWNRLGNRTRASASIRAYELQEVYGRRK